jgi:membrane protein required for colicin V production
MIDVIILAVMLYAVYKGWTTGLVAQVASLVGYLVGLTIAWSCYGRLADYLAPHLGSSGFGVSALAFLLILIAVPVALGIAANIITKAVDIMCLGWINRLAGAAVAFVKYTLFLGCILLVLNALHILGEEGKAESRLYEPVTMVWGNVWHNALGCSDADTETETDSDTIK